MESTYDFDLIKYFKSGLATVSILYTTQLNQSAAPFWQVELIDETVDTNSFNTGQWIEMISLLGCSYEVGCTEPLKPCLP
jgi:hypothetical protein